MSDSLLARAMPLIQQQLTINNLDPTPLLSYAGLASVSILGSPSQHSGAIMSLLGSSSTSGTPDPVMGALVMIAYLVASLVVGIFVYNRSEIK